MRSSAAVTAEMATSSSDEKVIGRPVREVLGLDFEGQEDHVGMALEWGVRRLGKRVVVNAEGDLPAKAIHLGGLRVIQRFSFERHQQL